MIKRKICYMCNKPIEIYEDTIKIQPRGDRMKYYHETCIERERVNNRHTYNLSTKRRNNK